MKLLNKIMLWPVLPVAVWCCVLPACTNGERSYKVISVTYSNGLDTLFSKDKTAAFKNALQNTTLEVTIQDDTLMTVSGVPGMTTLTLHRLKARKNSDMPKYTYRASDRDGNTLDISLSGTGFRDFTLRTRALYVFPEKIGADKLKLSASDTRKWQASIEVKGEKQ